MSESFAASSLAAPGLPPPRPAPMQKVTWHSVDFRTGRRGAPVRPVKLGTIGRALNEAKEYPLDVLIHDAKTDAPIPEWEPSTEPGLVMLVCVDENDNPIWGGLVYKRLGSSKPLVNLGMVTLEAYLDRRYVNADATFVGADQVSEIAKEIIQTTLASGAVLTIDAPDSSVFRDREYKIDDDKTILSVLAELADLADGIEFTVDLAWTDDTHQVLERIFRIRNRQNKVGFPGRIGLESSNPPAVFHMPGSVLDFEYLEDYSSEHGANAVVATSSGEGEDRPESLRHIAGGIVAGFGGLMAMFERRITPSTSITDTATLDEHAARELQETWDGLAELTLTAHLDTAPQLHVDWWLGDDVGVQLTGYRFPERMSSDGGKVPGYIAVNRCIGWEIDLEARVLKPTTVELNEIEVETL